MVGRPTRRISPICTKKYHSVLIYLCQRRWLPGLHIVFPLVFRFALVNLRSLLITRLYYAVAGVVTNFHVFSGSRRDGGDDIREGFKTPMTNSRKTFVSSSGECFSGILSRTLRNILAGDANKRKWELSSSLWYLERESEHCCVSLCYIYVC